MHDVCLSKGELGVLVVKEVLSKGDGECDKRKRKDCVSVE